MHLIVVVAKISCLIRKGGLSGEWTLREGLLYTFLPKILCWYFQKILLGVIPTGTCISQ